MQIGLKTRLGNLGLEINAGLQESKVKQAGEYALQYLIWHVGASKVFSEKTGFKRDAQFSDALGETAVEKLEDVLKDVFEAIEIKVGQAPPRADKYAKAIKAFVDIGFSQVEAEAMVAEQKAKDKAETPITAEESNEAIEG